MNSNSEVIELKILESYVSRQCGLSDNSLRPLSTNTLPSKTGPKLRHASVIARELITSFCTSKEAKLRDHLSLAFKCLYMDASGHDVTVSLLKKHQHYVVFLNSQTTYKDALTELSTIYNVLTSSALSVPRSLETLLIGVPPSHEIPISLIISFHFFVIQSVLQMVTANVQSIIRKDTHSALFWQVATTFLRGSNFDLCLATTDEQAASKYHRNVLKMLSGFVKVAEFIQAKKPSLQLRRSISALLSKIQQYNIELDFQQEIKLPDLDDSALKPFVCDLYQVASKAKANTKRPYIRSILKLLDSSNLLSESSLDPHYKQDCAAVLKVTKSEDSATSFGPSIKRMDPNARSFDICFESAALVSHRLKSITTKIPETERLSIIDDCTSFFVAAAADGKVFDWCLNNCIPNLFRHLKQHNQSRNLAMLARCCFDYAVKFGSESGFFSACETSLSLLAIADDEQLKTRLCNRIEYSISSLLRFAYTSQAATLIKSYVTIEPSRLTDNNVVLTISTCLAKGENVTSKFFGPQGIPQDLQLKLFGVILKPLGSKLKESRYHIITDMMNEINSELSFAAGYMVAHLFDIQVEFSQCKDSGCISDLVFKAGILANSFKMGITDLNHWEEIIICLFEWLDVATNSDIIGNFDVFEDILTISLQMGLYYHFIKLTDKFKSSDCQEPRCLLTVDLLQVQCSFALSNTESIPPRLRNAEKMLKRVYNGKFSDTCTLIDLDLSWLEYFIQSRDNHKSEIKFDEITSKISSRSEFDISGATNMSAEDKMSSFLIIARFSLLTAVMNQMEVESLSALRNSKLAIKLLNSILRKLEISTSLYAIKVAALHLLLKAHNLAFKIAKHLGLTKDAIHHCHELVKFTSQLCTSPMKSSYHFLNATLSKAIGDDHQANVQYSDGCENTWGSPIFELIEMTTSIILCRSQMSLRSYTEVRNRALNDLCNCQNASGYASVPYSLVRDLMNEAEASIINSSMKKPSLTALKIIEFLAGVASSQGEDLEREPNLLLIDREDKRDNTIIYFAKTPNSTRTSPQQERRSTLVAECMELVSKLTSERSLQKLGIQEMSKISQLIRHFVFITSSLGFCSNSDGAELLRMSFMMRDLSNSFPYFNLKLSFKARPMSTAAILPLLRNEGHGFENFYQKSLYEIESNLIPASWAIVTLDTCDLSGDLVITRIRGDADGIQTLKLPFDRRAGLKQNIDEYSKELRDIIVESNKSTKSDVTSRIRTKTDRMRWWRMRFELDSRLGALLQRMESSTIGGFRGIFDKYDYASKEFYDFHLELDATWKAAMGDPLARTMIDRHISELFFSVCVQDDNRPAKLENLEDLIEYTLQHQHLEMDSQFDKALFIDRLLRFKLQAPGSLEDEHLVIIPCRSCKYIPWESVNFLRGRSVSRMPSLACLAGLLRARKGNLSLWKNHNKDLLYVINPGSDLHKTQARFEPFFESFPSATGSAGRPPSEEWLMSKLLRTSLYIYLGHGGGEQYLRSSTLLKSALEVNEGLPTTLLMGCSSSAYHEHGSLPSSSNVFNWLVCGTPAIVTNLWDITDKDIDIFSLSVFAEWGLGLDGNDNHKSLAHAILKGRNACTLKYLNGAAPILHGLPLKLLQ